jgi:hypothetical protein
MNVCVFTSVRHYVMLDTREVQGQRYRLPCHPVFCFCITTIIILVLFCSAVYCLHPRFCTGCVLIFLSAPFVLENTERVGTLFGIQIVGPLLVFTLCNAGIEGSNPIRGIEVCMRLFRVCIVLCVGSDLATCWSPIQGLRPTVYRIKKLKKRPMLIRIPFHCEYNYDLLLGKQFW